MATLNTSLILITLLTLSAFQGLWAAPYVLPPENQGNWTPGVHVGVDGGIEQYLAGGVNDRAVTGNVIDVTQAPYNADNTGVSDVKAAVQNALSAAVEGDVVYFPDGTYRFESGFISTGNKNNITIRGSGVGQTTMHFSVPDTQKVFLTNTGGTFNKNPQTVSGTKTKGTATLEVGDTSLYHEGGLVAVRYENEGDNTRIINGAAPVWSAGGYPWARKLTCMVTSILDSTHITIDPPLPADATNLQLQVVTGPTHIINRNTRGLGFEDFSVTFDPDNHPVRVIELNHAINSWCHNIDFEDYARPFSSGGVIKLDNCYKTQISHCRFNAMSGSGSDGAIQVAGCSSLLIVDNIIAGPFGAGIMDSGNANNCVFAYNYRDEGWVTIFHNAHPSLNLVEGNVGPYHQSDGYWGSSSHSTIYRNWFWRFGAVLNRFKRNYVLAGNVIGEDGVRDAVYGLGGNPNMGNGDADGFAGPTGLSEREGTTDYKQPGYGIHEYVIQEEDIFVGDFWEDWEVTGTLISRTSDTEGVFTVSGGKWHTGLAPKIWWNDKTEDMPWGVFVKASGSDVTIQWANGVLPAEGTPVQMYMGAAGWQERDLDVQASSTLLHNYESQASGQGAIGNAATEVLPNSLAYANRPDWWNADGFAGLWPPVDPSSPNFDHKIIPAGYRHALRANGEEEIGPRPPQAPNLKPAQQ
jgi:hypothetical protein